MDLCSCFYLAWVPFCAELETQTSISIIIHFCKINRCLNKFINTQICIHFCTPKLDFIVRNAVLGLYAHRKLRCTFIMSMFVMYIQVTLENGCLVQCSVCPRHVWCFVHTLFSPQADGHYQCVGWTDLLHVIPRKYSDHMSSTSVT